MSDKSIEQYVYEAGYDPGSIDDNDLKELDNFRKVLHLTAKRKQAKTPEERREIGKQIVALTEEQGNQS